MHNGGCGSRPRKLQKGETEIMSEMEECLDMDWTGKWEPDFRNPQSGIRLIGGRKVEIWLISCPCCLGKGTHAQGDGPGRVNVDCAVCFGVGEWTLTNPYRPQEILIIEPAGAR